MIIAFQVKTKTVHDLPQQHQFPGTARNETPGLKQDLFRVAAAFLASFARNDTVGAGVGTAEYDRQILRDCMVAFQAETEFVIEDFIHLLTPGFRSIVQPFFEGSQKGFGIRWSGEDVHPGKTLLECLIAVDTNQAAHQTNHKVRIGKLDGSERVETTQGTVFSALTHHASIQDDQIRLAGIRGGAQTERFKCPREAA